VALNGKLDHHVPAGVHLVAVNPPLELNGRPLQVRIPCPIHLWANYVFGEGLSAVVPGDVVVVDLLFDPNLLLLQEPVLALRFAYDILLDKVVEHLLRLAL